MYLVGGINNFTHLLLKSIYTHRSKIQQVPFLYHPEAVALVVSHAVAEVLVLSKENSTQVLKV